MSAAPESTGRVRFKPISQKQSALVISLAAAVIFLLVSYGVPMSADQKAGILGLIGAMLAILQGWATTTQTTDNSMVVAKAVPGLPEAVAGQASVYADNTPLSTVPAGLPAVTAAQVISGSIPPESVAKLDMRHTQ